jgi:hypothetical protein
MTWLTRALLLSYHRVVVTGDVKCPVEYWYSRSDCRASLLGRLHFILVKMANSRRCDHIGTCHQFHSIPYRLVSRRYSVAQHILRKVAQDEFQDANCICTGDKATFYNFALRARLDLLASVIGERNSDTASRILSSVPTSYPIPTMSHRP